MTASRGEVETALAEVLDPEYPVSLVDMGPIRDIAVQGSTATVSVSYCSLGCPCIALIEQDITERLLQLEGIQHVDVRESFDPWTRSDVSRKGLTLLQQVGVG
jgi:metal-sulfur cluster biosynthetic enzyme